MEGNIMTTKNTTAKQTVLLAKAADFAHDEELQNIRAFVNPKTGKQSYELQFANGAKVIMPANWNLHFDLVQGMRYDAYWDNGTFHLNQR